jgi:hypothetical protein
MGFGSWLKWIPLAAAPMMLISGMAVAQKDDLCFMKTSSGQRIALDKFCGKSGDKAVSDFMWDENNYDPNFVTKTADGWSVLLGGAHPFKKPNGTIAWPDGRITTNENVTFRHVIDSQGKLMGIQYYKENRTTPIKPGETLNLPNGITVIQSGFQ